MSQTERLFKIEQLIKARGVIPFDTLLGELEVSRATLKRDLAYEFKSVQQLRRDFERDVKAAGGKHEKNA